MKPELTWKPSPRGLTLTEPECALQSAKGEKQSTSRVAALWQRGRWSVTPLEPLFSKTQQLYSLNTSPDVYLLMRFQGYSQTVFC